MLKVNYDNLRNVQSVANYRLYLSIKDKIETTLDHFMFESNNTEIREVIKQKVLEILMEGKKQLMDEGKSIIVGEQIVNPNLLEPDVEVCDDKDDKTKLHVLYNKDAEVIMNTLEKNNNY